MKKRVAHEVEVGSVKSNAFVNRKKRQALWVQGPIHRIKETQRPNCFDKMPILFITLHCFFSVP
jgi:hypothetical protein